MESPREETQKSQPWKELLSNTKHADICGVTDRPWMRQKLADDYDEKIRGERQGRHPGYDEYRRADPFKHLYKAEGASGPARTRGDELALSVDAFELQRKLDLLEKEERR